MAPTSQRKLGVNEPSSGSVTVAEQVNALPVCTPELGEIAAAVVNCGSELPIVTVVVAVSVLLLLSVAVAVQAMT